MQYTSELSHYGIPGMKWGRRRSSGSAKSPSPSKKKQSPKMSDDELRKVVTRMQLEKQYSQLKKESVTSGKNYIQKLAKAGATAAAVTTTGITLYNNSKKIRDIIDSEIIKKL